LFDNIFHNLKYTNIIWKNLVEVGEITSVRPIIKP
jgi:hypothetical protein